MADTKYKVLEVKLHLRSDAESYSMALKKSQNVSKMARNMTNDSLSFHSGNCEIIRETICIASFLLHTQNFAFKYFCKHNDHKSHCFNIVNPRHILCLAYGY